MKGILIATHGELAKGFRSALSMFFGNELEQLDVLCLHLEDNAEVFSQEMEKKIKELDTGDGVVVLTDMFGGTPCNQALLKSSEKVEVLCGVNMPMLMELMADRAKAENSDSLIEIGRIGLFDAKRYVNSTCLVEDVEDFD